MSVEVKSKRALEKHIHVHYLTSSPMIDDLK